MTAHMTKEQKQMARRLRAKGLTLAEITRQLGPYSRVAVLKVLRGQKRPGLPDDWMPAVGRLSVTEREDILVGIANGETLTAIARSRPTAAATPTGHGTRTDGHGRARDAPSPSN